MHTLEQLERAIAIRKEMDPLNAEIAKTDGIRVKVQVLEDELNSILGVEADGRKHTRRPATEATKAKMRAAWAARAARKVVSAAPEIKPPTKKSAKIVNRSAPPVKTTPAPLPSLPPSDNPSYNLE